jgi:hypothetical protein
MFDFFFRYFLVFPKILISGHWGILIGEIVSLFFFLAFLCRRRKISTSPQILGYYGFVTYYVLGSSVIAALHFGFFPAHSVLYFARLLLLFTLFLWSFEYYQKTESDSKVIELVYNRPFIVHFIICLVIMLAYYSTHSPTANEIMWGYEVGLRMIPLAGLVIDFDSFFLLKAISGSGNLLSGWALAILIVNLNREGGRINRTVVMVAVMSVLLTVSRGGFLTMGLYLFYTFVRSFRFKISVKSFIVTLIFIAGLFAYFSFSEETPLPNIFSRLDITYQGGDLDGSSQGRLDNYVVLFNSWTRHWYYIVFGFGFDEQAVWVASQQTVIESYFLQVLFCSGLIGVSLLILFYLLAFIRRRSNFWYRCFWEFLFFQSLISWTITGGDFLAPHASYIFLTFLGFGFAKSMNESNQN